MPPLFLHGSPSPISYHVFLGSGWLTRGQEVATQT